MSYLASAKISPLLARLKDERASRMSGGIYHKVQVELTYNSNHMEGSQLTHDQTRLIFETATVGTARRAGSGTPAYRLRTPSKSGWITSAYPIPIRCGCAFDRQATTHGLKPDARRRHRCAAHLPAFICALRSYIRRSARLKTTSADSSASNRAAPKAIWIPPLPLPCALCSSITAKISSRWS